MERSNGRRRRNRGLERLKSLLILLLSLSALYLTLLALVPNRTSASPIALAEALSALLNPQQSQSTPAAGTQTSLTVSARPTRMSVYDGTQRFSLQYDAANVDRLYDSLGILLGEALASAKAPAQVPESEWRAALRSPGVWFDFLGVIPLDTLCAWTGEGVYNPLLNGSARQLTVALEPDQQVALYYHNEDDGLYYTCETSVAFENHMDTLISGYGSNGVSFAFELGDSNGYSGLDPYVLVSSASLAPQVYRAVNPLSGLDETIIEEIQTALSFHTSYYPIPDGIRIREGQETLELGSDGQVSYTTAEDTQSRYPLEDSLVNGTTELIETTYALAIGTVGRYCGSARLYLMGLEETADGLDVRYGYCLNGSAVNLSDEGCAARFTVEDGQLTGFTLTFRRYEESGQTSLVLPERQAAAALEALDAQETELVLCYWDNGSDTVQAGWAAQ